MRKVRLPPGKDWGRLQLQASEASSLKAALAQTQTTGSPEKLHIHADVQAGRVVFSPDKDHDEHVFGAQPEVSLGTDQGATKSLPVNIAATPAALKMLQSRSGQ